MDQNKPYTVIVFQERPILVFRTEQQCQPFQGEAKMDNNSLSKMDNNPHSLGPAPIIIPNGYCSGNVKSDSANLIRKLTFDNDFMPRYVKNDLYKKLYKAIPKDIDVKRQTVPHSSAFIIITKSNNPCPEIKHSISIDVAVSMRCKGYQKHFKNGHQRKQRNIYVNYFGSN